MTWWEAAIMGVVQGLTEFFPVSSSGHLVMTERLLGLALPGVAFEVALHMATLVSVLVVYRARVLALLRGCLRFDEESAWPYVLKLALASIPAAIVGVGLKDFFEARFDDPVFAGTMLLVTGCVVWSTRWARDGFRGRAPDLIPVAVAAVVSLLAGTLVPFLAVVAIQGLIMLTARATAPAETQAEPAWGGALLMGIAQALAILPGISRSGSTVVAGLWRRIDAVAAAEFSFLMSIPAILGAGVLSLPDLSADGAGASVPALVAGSLAALVSGVLAIRFFVALLKRQSFHAFAWYCWAAGALFLLYVHGGG